ncbi:unnamed protein product [Closterium sp. NIES-54]
MQAVGLHQHQPCATRECLPCTPPATPSCPVRCLRRLHTSCPRTALAALRRPLPALLAMPTARAAAKLPPLLLPPALLLSPVLLLLLLLSCRLRCCCCSAPCSARTRCTSLPCAVRYARCLCCPAPCTRAALAAAAAITTTVAAVTAAMVTPSVLTFGAEGHPLEFKSWLEGLHLYLHNVTSHKVSLFEHTSGSLPVPKAPAEPAATAGEETSLPPLQPVAVDFGGPGIVGGGDAEGSGSGGASFGGADSGGARSPLVGGVGGTSAGGAGAGTRGVPGTGGPGVCAGGAGSGGASQSLPQRPIFLEQPSLSLPESALHDLPRFPKASAEPTASGTATPLLFPPLHSPLTAPSRYFPSPVSVTERRVPVSCSASPATSRVARELIVLLLPPKSSLLAVLDPLSDLAHAARPNIPCCLAALVTAPAASIAASSALVAELAGFAATCRRAYLADLVSVSLCPPSVGREFALGCDVLEDRQFELEYLPYPLSIRTRFVAPGKHHPQWQAARRVLRYLVRLASRT